MSRSHSTGPWHVGHFDPFDDIGSMDGRLDVYDADRQNIVAKTASYSDAALTSAAPEMLDLLEELVNGGAKSDSPELWDRIDVVIKKAKGEL